MANYKGNHCPVCNEVFAEGDDIVVCPDCGTPYHRACWFKTGVCVHEGLHGTGFEWKPDAVPGVDDTCVCPNCGTPNPVSGRYCNHCGVPLPTAGDTRTRPDAQGPIYARQDPPQPHTAPSGSSAANADGSRTDSFGGMFRRELGPDDPIDGIKARDWASYLGGSSLYYLIQFLRMDETRRKTSVSFAAFFLGPVYFFYRKMWKAGILFAVLTLGLTFPTVLALLQAAGSPLVAGMDLGWLVPASYVCTFLNWCQMFVRSLFALYWYKKESARRIREICDRMPEGQERSDALILRGGTSVAAVVIYLLVYLALVVGLYWLMGPGRDAAVNALMSAFVM